MPSKKNILLCCLSAIVLILSGCRSTADISSITPAPTATQTIEPFNSKLTVHFIDVGQADAALLQCGDDTMLIDGGNNQTRLLALWQLQSLIITKTIFENHYEYIFY